LLRRVTAHAIAAMGLRRTFQILQLFQAATVRAHVTLGWVYSCRSNVWSELFAAPSARTKASDAREE